MEQSTQKCERGEGQPALAQQVAHAKPMPHALRGPWESMTAVGVLERLVVAAAMVRELALARAQERVQAQAQAREREAVSEATQ